MGDAEQNKTLRKTNVKLSSELLGVFFWFNSLKVSMALAHSFVPPNNKERVVGRGRSRPAMLKWKDKCQKRTR